MYLRHPVDDHLQLFSYINHSRRIFSHEFPPQAFSTTNSIKQALDVLRRNASRIDNNSPRVIINRPIVIIPARQESVSFPFNPQKIHLAHIEDKERGEGTYRLYGLTIV
jgi:hypothetical protein